MHAHMIMHMDGFLSCDLDLNLYLRLVLACIIVLAVHGFFVIEQPRQNTFVQLLPVAMVSRKKLLCILSHKVMQYIHACMVSCGVVATIHIACMQVYFANWWMMSYGTSYTEKAASSIKLALGFRS